MRLTLLLVGLLVSLLISLALSALTHNFIFVGFLPLIFAPFAFRSRRSANEL